MIGRVLLVGVVLAGCRGSESRTGDPVATASAQPAAAPADPATTSAPTGSAAPADPAVVVDPCDLPATAATTSTGDDVLTLVPARPADLPGWSDDHLAEAVPAFLASCAQLATLADDQPIGSGPYAGTARDWRAACTAAAAVPAGDDAAARRFFEHEFAFYAARGRDGFDGKMTGYYVESVRGSRTRGGAYQFPLYARPPDLVSVQLSEFIDDGRSRRIWGRLDPASGRLTPYPTRAEIHGRDPDNREVLLWLDDPAAVIATEIEGSAKATLPDGSVVWLAFAGKNGRSGRGNGAVAKAARALRDSFDPGETRPTALRRRLARFHAVADPKRSMVFFEIEPRAGAIGTQDVVLTPMRSVAVDRAVIALSTPVFVTTRAPTHAGGPLGPWQHLVIAQDTGGAILGTIRGDLFFGDDPATTAIGGRINGPGRMWLLLPRGLKVPTAAP